MGIDLITRREWKARAPKGAYTPISSTRGVKVHYTGGKVPADLADPGNHHKCVELVRGFQNHHMDGNGWLDLAYSMVACPHRKVFEGRGPGRLTAANGAGLNSQHYSVLALVGSSGLTHPNDGVLHGVLDAIDYLRDHGRAGKEIKGHRDGFSTDCPGGPLYEWVRRGAPRPGGSAPARPATPKPTPAKPKPSGGWPGRYLAYKPDAMMTGEDVAAWQRILKRNHHTIDVDGKFGRMTRAATVVLQREHGEVPDGIVGPRTWALG
ncbi:peptidoglycan recognition protein family protein (plasmid) [Streptosporangium sandarakinum]|uniref:peptidoglycan recognition protein family protein n=1 Tax=Streptosporangium sandarakinum TaxID=1260955 RepID=UPI003D90A06A